MIDITLLNFVRRTETKFSNGGIDNPKLDTQLLVGHALDLDRAQMFAQAQRVLTENQIVRAEQLIARRLNHEPVARILGEREFWGLPFGLNEATLEPRPDSETLVETALKIIPKKNGRILDLGTGTGCLLLSLLHELPEATGLGLDIAPRAIEQAQKNAARLNVATRATFQTGLWLEGLRERFDIIISNPPYIARGDIAGLMPEVRDYDPPAALDGGVDGLDAYRLLIPQLPKFLNAKGLAVFEVGQGRATAVQNMFLQAGFDNVQAHADLGGILRCVSGIHTS